MLKLQICNRILLLAVLLTAGLYGRVASAGEDWLIDNTPYRAEVKHDRAKGRLTLTNGLIKREFVLTPNAAAVALDNLVSGEAFLRAVTPEARLTINGVNYSVGGLIGQPNRAFLDESWIDSLKADPQAFIFVGYEVSEPQERMHWKRVRHAAPGAQWPPKGVVLRMDYKLPANAVNSVSPDNPVMASGMYRNLLISDDLTAWDDKWRIHTSSSHPRSSFSNEGKAGEIYTPQNTCVYAEADLPAGTRLVEAEFESGTDKSRAYGPGIALIWPDRTVKLHLSPGGDGYNPYMSIACFDGTKWVSRFGEGRKYDDVPYTLRIRIDGDGICLEAKPQGGDWMLLARLKDRPEGDPVKVRIGKMDSRGDGVDDKEAGALARTRVQRFRAYSDVDPLLVEQAAEEQEALRNLTVSVYYELYDGLPAYAKWMTVRNDGNKTLTINKFLNDILAAVEYTSRVEERGVYYPRPNIHVETDYAFGGFDVPSSSRSSVQWLPDYDYTTQVMWAMTTPCLLHVGPVVGPEQDVRPGETFTTFTSYLMPYDSYDRERNGLALRRLYRTVAPWVTENPLMMHLNTCDTAVVRNAIDQCADVGFEMLILSFGSGFNIEDTTAVNITAMKSLADYARSRGIDIGGYSLLSSRSAATPADNVVSPAGQKPTHGVMPALASAWGQWYMGNLYDFFKATGQTVFEHDGSYPGDFDMTPRPPLQKGGDDSQWVQWRIISDFYKWCRGEGIYLNIPDYYFLAGGSKIGMGYREVNWSLPRAQQLIHTRQNIYDGTWEKTPSMGWMHVPLTQYHGGGEAATIEPLCEHLDHYRTIMVSNLGAGVQAVYRGRRLYDTDSTRTMVKGMVDWYKRHRYILESDIIHLRRPDGRDLDYYLHANPSTEEKGLLMVFNPTAERISRKLTIPLYYTGLRGSASVSKDEGKFRRIGLDDFRRAEIEVDVPAGDYSCFIFK